MAVKAKGEAQMQVQEVVVFQASDGSFYLTKECALEQEKRLSQIQCIEEFIESGQCPYPHAARRALVDAIIAWEAYRSQNKERTQAVFP